MFSVPESIAIRAPEETANHSTGTPSRSARSSAAITRAHSGSASEPSASRRVAEQRDAQHALGMAVGAVADQPDDDARACWWPAAGRPGRASVVEVVLDELAGGIAGGLAARSRLDDLGRVHGAAAARGDDPLGALVERLQRLVGGPPSSTVTPRPAGLNMRSTRSRSSPSSRMRTRSWTISSPRPALMRAKRPMTALASLGREVDRRPGVEQQRGSSAGARAAGGATGRSASPRTPGGPSARARAAR